MRLDGGRGSSRLSEARLAGARSGAARKWDLVAEVAGAMLGVASRRHQAPAGPRGETRDVLPAREARLETRRPAARSCPGGGGGGDDLSSDWCSAL